MIYLIFIALESLALFLFVLYLVYEYSSKDVAFHIKLLTFISWIFSFSIVVILPIDIYFVKTFPINFETPSLYFYLEFIVRWRP